MSAGAPVGFVLVDKPVGPTSHDIVDVVRRALSIRRIGHAGTLDPPASGLLVVGVGPATRLVSQVQVLPKTYLVTGGLGVRTDTLDAAGEVVSREPVSATADEIRSVAAKFAGEIDQRPPAVSAVKIRGERAYAKARRGEHVELPTRRVTVYELEVIRTSAAAFDARVVCSSGTYVRSLVADIGEALGCGAHVVSLRRTAIGHLEVADAVAPGDVGPDDVRPVHEVLTHLHFVQLDAESAALASNGRPVALDAPEGEVLVCGPDGAAIGVFASTAGILRPVTVLPR